MVRLPSGARPTVGQTSSLPWRAIALLAFLMQPASPAVGQTASVDRTDSEQVVPSANEPRGRGTIVTRSLSLVETYTDNVLLAPQRTKTSDWITQIVPGLSVTANTPRLRLDASYTPEITYYSRTDREEGVFHRGRATSKLELAEQLLFLDAGAKVDQYDISLFGSLTSSNVNITGNRATAASAYVTPYLVRDLGSAARAEAKLTYSVWNSDEDAPPLPDNDGLGAILRLTSAPAHKFFTWKAAYSRELIKYKTRQETTTEVLTADAQLAIAPTVRLLAQSGYERYDTGITPEPLEGSRWSAGVLWTPGPRTLLTAAGGERLKDRTYSFEFRHRTRLTAWSASYTEDVTNTRTQFLVPETASTAAALDQMFLSRYPDAAEREKAVQDFIARTGLPPSLGGPVNFFSDELFLQKRWQASIGLLGTRNTLIASAFWESREALTGPGLAVVSGDFGASDTIRMTGCALAWNWRVTPKSTWNMEAGYTRNEFLDIDQTDEYITARAGLTQQLQPRLSASIFYRRQQRSSTPSTTDYVENAGIATLRMTF